MAALYNVPTKNRFAQLDSDAEDAAEEPKGKTTGAATTSVAKAKQQQQQGSVPSASSPGGRGGSKAPNRAIGGGYGGGYVEVTDGVGEAPAGPRVRKQKDFAIPDRSERIAARGRPIRAGFGGATSNKREFDRHSGTGRGREMKKSGAGGHNWGNPAFEDRSIMPTDVAIDEAETAQDAVTPPPGDDVNAPVAGEGATPPNVEGGAPAPPAPEENAIDFMEYQRAMRAKRAAVLALQQQSEHETRVVDADELEKDGFQKYEKEETEEERAARELQKNRILHQEDDQDQHTEQRSRPPKPSGAMMTLFGADFGGGRSYRGGRGGQMGGGRFGGNRGGGGRGGGLSPPQMQQQPQIQIDISDKAAFPSL